MSEAELLSALAPSRRGVATQEKTLAH